VLRELCDIRIALSLLGKLGLGIRGTLRGYGSFALNLWTDIFLHVGDISRCLFFSFLFFAITHVQSIILDGLLPPGVNEVVACCVFLAFLFIFWASKRDELFV
jgi:hypothetical protein